MTMRDEAVAFVKEGFEAGKWTTRADCYKLIEEHVRGTIVGVALSPR